MTLFPLDAVHNASVSREIEPALAELREEIAAYTFSPDIHGGDTQDILEVFDLARPRLNVLVRMLRDMRGRRGADIGSGYGFLPVLLSRCGLQAIATEQDDRILGFASERGIEVLHYEIGETLAPFSPESLDFLVLGEVLEHLKQPPVRALTELASALKPEGLLLLTTPNIARMQHLHALAAGENFLEPFSEHIPPGADSTDYVEHVREYSIREVVDAVEAVGLEVTDVLMTGWGDGGYDLLPNPFVNEIMVVKAEK